MPERAKVTSVDAIEFFRTALLVYLGKTKPVLEDAVDEVSRTREWLRSEQRLYWENQVRRRARQLENAQQALFSAELAKLRAPTYAELIAVRRAKSALTEAEDKLRRIKRWILEYDNLVAPFVKQLEQLRTILATDMPNAALSLGKTVKALDAYAGERVTPSLSAPQAPNSNTSTETNGAEASNNPATVSVEEKVEPKGSP